MFLNHSLDLEFNCFLDSPFSLDIQSNISRLDLLKVKIGIKVVCCFEQRLLTEGTITGILKFNLYTDKKHMYMY